MAAFLDFFYACLDHLRIITWGLYYCAKCGQNRCGGFDDVYKFLYILQVRFSMFIHVIM